MKKNSEYLLHPDPFFNKKKCFFFINLSYFLKIEFQIVCQIDQKYNKSEAIITQGPLDESFDPGFLVGKFFGPLTNNLAVYIF